MTDVTGDLAIPDPDERAALNAALLATGTETGFTKAAPHPGPTTSTNGHRQPRDPSLTNPENTPSNQPHSKDHPIHHVQGLDPSTPVGLSSTITGKALQCPMKMRIGT
jgi:hypothetical protein